MDVTYYDKHKVILCKNFFTQEEYDEMWLELSYLCNDDFLVDSEKAGGARNEKGELLRFNRGLFIDSIMDNSSIVNFMNRIFEKETYEKFVTYDNSFSVLENKNIKQSNLINHYMGNHLYDYHRDKCSITAITTFHKLPKPYTGGDLTFREGDDILNPDLQLRDMVIFLGSQTYHAVSSVHLNESVNQSSNMNGRISVSKFIGEYNVTT